jgi:hypothetical protein
VFAVRVSMNLDKNLETARAAAPAMLGPGLGIFSLALGVAEVIGTKPLAKAIGVDPDGIGPNVMRAFGFREIAAGIAVLVQRDRPIPLWARVVGDAMDLTALALASRGRRAVGKRLVIAAIAVAGVTALDVIASIRANRASGNDGIATEIR